MMRMKRSSKLNLLGQHFLLLCGYGIGLGGFELVMSILRSALVKKLNLTDLVKFADLACTFLLSVCIEVYQNRKVSDYVPVNDI